MHRAIRGVVVCAALVGAAAAGAPKEAEVQGLYEGSWKDAKGEGKLEARVVALGSQAYKVYVREGIGEKSAAKAELDGKTEADAVTFGGKAGAVPWEGAYADGAVRGKFGEGGTFELKRIERKPPSLGAKPPAGAIVLFDGTSTDEWTKGGKPCPWKIENGYAEVRGGSCATKRKFGSIQLHLEFRCNLAPAARGQGRANSGVYLPNGDEIQVLDSFGMDTYTGGGCGGLYRYRDPDAFDKFSLASLPPLEWQTCDVTFLAPGYKGPLLGRLEFRLVASTKGEAHKAWQETGKAPAGYTEYLVATGKYKAPPDKLLVADLPQLTGEHVATARVNPPGAGGSLRGCSVAVQFTPAGEQLFGKVTGDNVGERLAIIHSVRRDPAGQITDKGTCLSAPVIRMRISGDAVIEGNFDEKQANDLADTLMRQAEALRNGLAKARATVVHNGLVIHNDVELRHAGGRSGGILLQDHGNPLRYRNIWVLPLDER